MQCGERSWPIGTNTNPLPVIDLQTMPSEEDNHHEYLPDQFKCCLDKWTENRDCPNTFMLGWALVKLEKVLHQHGADGDLMYPKEFFLHLHTMDGETIRTLPIEITEAAIGLEQSMMHHYGLACLTPAVIFHEQGGDGLNQTVAYFGRDRCMIRDVVTPVTDCSRRFVTKSNLRPCIRYLNNHYMDGPCVGDTDLEVHGCKYGDAAGQVTIIELYNAEGRGRNEIVAVWNLMENLGRRD